MNERLVELCLLARALDDLERRRLLPGCPDPIGVTVPVQFSSGGHELVQVALGLALGDPGDAVAPYYRSRPLALALGLSPAQALAGTLARRDSVNGGRDTGVALQPWPEARCRILPMSGSVGAQFPVATGWAEARRGAGDRGIAVACGGDGAVATGGFWAALGCATTRELPLLFVIEDNGWAISTPATVQTPGGDITANLAAWPGLRRFNDAGGDPLATLAVVRAAVTWVRQRRRPALLRCRVPRLWGHAWQDDQAWRPAADLAAAIAADPLAQLERLVPGERLVALQAAAHRHAAAALDEALTSPAPDPALRGEHLHAVAIGSRPAPPPPAEPLHRLTLAAALRQALDEALERDPRVVLLGQDIGTKGGVHGVTHGLAERHGATRVIDAALNEDAILGRAAGMAQAGLRPIVEIQFRKYLEPATEAFRDIGSLRWRSRGAATAPVLLRLPYGHAGTHGDPAHGQCDEVALIRAFGWRVVMPADAADAVHLVRAALMSEDPVALLEHRGLYQAPEARADWPDQPQTPPLARARLRRPGTAATVVAWGALVHRAEAAIAHSGIDAALWDLRCLWPWDRRSILAHVATTGRLLVVHEDAADLGLGAEIIAACAEAGLLTAPPRRLAGPAIPCPFASSLREPCVPDAEAIAAALATLANQPCPSR